jgi:hypothetical protein
LASRSWHGRRFGHVAVRISQASRLLGAPTGGNLMPMPEPRHGECRAEGETVIECSYVKHRCFLEFQSVDGRPFQAALL